MSSYLDSILSFQLGNNKDFITNHIKVLDQLERLDLIRTSIRQDGTNSSTINRWSLRLTSLLSSQHSSSLQTASLTLLHPTFLQSPHLLLTLSPKILPFLLSLLTKKGADKALYEVGLRVLEEMMRMGQERPDWGRECFGQGGVIKIAKDIVKRMEDPVSSELHPSSLSFLLSLIPLYPTQLRPLSPSLHNLTISLLSSPSSSPLPAKLYSSLYLLAPKGKEGLKESWKLSVESLVGSIWVVVRATTEGVFVEDLSMPSPSPLSFPSPPPLSSLHTSLLTLLRTPPTPLVPSVPLPLSHLLNLSLHLTSLNPLSPLHPSRDQQTLTKIFANLPQSNTMGAELVAQLALAVPVEILAGYSNEILSALSRAIIVSGGGTKRTLLGAYTVVVKALGGAGDPEEGKRSLARVWREVLLGLGVWEMEEEIDEEEKRGKKRKKVDNRTFDTTSAPQPRLRLTTSELHGVLHSLSCLTTLLSTPFASFLPPKLIYQAESLLLSVALSPSFFAAKSTPDAVYGKERRIGLFCKQDRFRRGVMCALRELGRREVGGRASEWVGEVWRKGVRDADEQIRAISHEGMQSLLSKIHPTLPPIVQNTAFTQNARDRTGGELGELGGLVEGVKEEFGERVGEEREVEREEEEEEEEEKVERKEEVVRTFESPSTTTTMTTGSAFKAFAKPFAPATKEDEKEMEEKVSTTLETQVSVGGKSAETRENESDSESDEEGMPTIVMDSDEE